MTIVHIHEDDEGMRNIYPSDAIDDAMEDIGDAKASAMNNLAPDGAGWTDVHIISEPKKTFQDIGLRWDIFAATIGEILPRIELFEVGFGANNPLQHKDIDPKCFGFGQSLYLKLETEGDDLRAIWFDARTDVEEELLALKRALEAIDKICPSMIADYWLNTGGLLGDQKFLEAYICELQENSDPYTDPSVLSGYSAPSKGWFGAILRLFRTR